MPRMLKALAAVGLLGIVVLWFALPDVRDELIDSVKRLSAPEFILAPYEMKAQPQDAWISEYQNLGYGLKCYGNLRPEEHISRDDDYACHAIIKSAYEGIPARLVSFHFHKGSLQHIRLEFPEKSFDQLHAYLNRYFSGVTRLDQLPRAAFDPDVFGKSLMAWPARNGVLATSKEAMPGQPVILLWTSKEALMRDLQEKKQKALMELQKLQAEKEEAVSNAVDNNVATPTESQQAAPQEPIPAKQTAVPGKRAKTHHKPRAKHAVPADADLRNCLDKPTERDIARCAAQ